ncbi:MAG: class II aldolase/adducin family protein [Betaproteobacteria bacterium]|nr:rRNA adenine methyltransferase [Betaproteobacteria bacterium]
MSVTQLKQAESTRESAALRELKVQLAAAMRMAVLHELDEGIDNHFTARVPGQDGRYLILPFGYHWSEARADDLIMFDDQGHTVAGEGEVELSAWCIHAAFHRLTGAEVVLHTHQPWAVALNMLKDNRLLNATQTAVFLAKDVAYDDHYDGTADQPSEGERLARIAGNKPIVFMKNHGVITTGKTVAQAYRRLYKLERACRTQMLAMATGREIQEIDPAIVAKVLAPAELETHSSADRDRLFFEAMMRVLDRDLPGYR